MLRIFIESGQIEDGKLFVSGDDVAHMMRVLRMKCGEAFEAVDETGVVHSCRIHSVSAEEIEAEIMFSDKGNAELPNEITLYMALPKFEKMELIIQKAVELGAARIVPVKTARCVVKLDEKKAASKRARWQTIAEAASKQSKRLVIPEVFDVTDFAAALAEAKTQDAILFPYEGAADITETRATLSSLTEGQSIALFIGPEGGFDEAEVDAAMAAGAKVITLGRRILRTETAAIATLSILMYLLERK